MRPWISTIIWSTITRETSSSLYYRSAIKVPLKPPLHHCSIEGSMALKSRGVGGGGGWLPWCGEGLQSMRWSIQGIASASMKHCCAGRYPRRSIFRGAKHAAPCARSRLANFGAGVDFVTNNMSTIVDVCYKKKYSASLGSFGHVFYARWSRSLG